MSAYENNPHAVNQKINFINSLYQELDKTKNLDKSVRGSLNAPKSEERSFRLSSNMTITRAPRVMRKKVST